MLKAATRGGTGAVAGVGTRNRVQNVCPAQDREVICDGAASYVEGRGVSTAWAVFNTDTINLTTDTRHVLGKTALEFDKTDGAANTVYGGVTLTLANGIDLSRFLASDLIEALFYVSSVADIVSVHIRMGTSASHYNTWTMTDEEVKAAVWQKFSMQLSDSTFTVVGNGWDPSSVKYIAFLVEFDAQDDALADIFLDHILLKSISPSPKDSIPDPKVVTCTQLTAAGSTAAWNVEKYRHHTFQVLVASSDTSVDYRAEGSNDGTDWFNLADDEADTQKLADGTYKMHKSDFTCQQMRFTMVTEAGGTAVTLDVVYYGRP